MVFTEIVVSYLSTMSSASFLIPLRVASIFVSVFNYHTAFFVQSDMDRGSFGIIVRSADLFLFTHTFHLDIETP